jgi:branched-subunit amino acid transport protein
MICPQCGFEQPESAECMRCGVVVSRYNGPVADSASGSFSLPEVPAMAAAPAMASAVAGTVYDGPPPGSGTVYSGPAAGNAVRRTSAPVGYRGALGVGQVLGQTFTVYFRNFIPFALLTAIVMAPLFIAQSAMQASASAGNLAAVLPSAIITMIGAIVCPYIATSAITYGVFQQMRRQDTSIVDCLRLGLSSLVPVLGLAIVQGVVVAVGLMACLIPGILLMVLGR